MEKWIAVHGTLRGGGIAIWRTKPIANAPLECEMREVGWEGGSLPEALDVVEVLRRIWGLRVVETQRHLGIDQAVAGTIEVPLGRKPKKRGTA
jgi:hypothetical protein